MPAAGIIAEYNPLHCGHVHLLEETRRRLGPGTDIVCVMSGNFVQRGDFALVDKFARAGAALQCGADLVLELPLPWALSSAEGFAAGAVAALRATGVVACLVFGSESGDAAPLVRLADALRSEEFPPALRRELARGDSFAAARQRAAAALLSPEEARALERPNDLLGVEYCKALSGSGIQPIAVPRRGDRHDSGLASGYSASALRDLIRQGREADALALLPAPMADAYRAQRDAGRAPVFLEHCEQALLARLRFLEEDGFAALDPGHEGLYRRLFRASRSACSFSQLLDAAKTRRYPMARLRRMALWAYLGLPPAPPPRLPYLRVLAAGERGRALLAAMRRQSTLPVITKPAAVRRLPEDARRLFALEARAARLYALACPIPHAGDEWRTGPVIRP